MLNPANVRETRIALGFKTQSALQIANAAGEYFSTTKINAALNDAKFTTENDAKDIGKGNEFAQQNFKTSVDVSGTIEKILSSQFAAWAFSFALGNVVKTTAGVGFKYTITVQDPILAGIEMPAFTFVEAIRQGANAVLDRAGIGCCINDLTLALKSGPGRQNAMLTAAIMGCGKLAEPSGVVIPALTSEAYLNAANCAISINGIDYVNQASFVSADIAIKNAIRGDTGYYPGSGVDSNGFQMRGRMEMGDREHGVNFVARYANGSTELTSLKAVTEGTAVFSLTGGLMSDGITHHAVKVTYHRTVINTATIADDAGIVTVHTTILPMWDQANGLVTVEVVTDMDGIFSPGA